MNKYDREIEELKEELAKNKKNRRGKRTTKDKIDDLNIEQRIKELKKKSKKVSTYTKKYAKKNTVATPINTKKVAEIHDRLDEKMNLLIRQKAIVNEDIIKTLEVTKGNISRAAAILELYEATLYRKVKTDPELIEAMEIINQRLIDKAKEVLWDELEKGNHKVATFVLETKGKTEGFHKKIVKEISGTKDGEPIKIEEKTADALKVANNAITRAMKEVI